MVDGFKFHWIMMGFGAVVVGKILANAVSVYLKFSM